jgi:glycine cleavage system pyridoxal-binding protein P
MKVNLITQESFESRHHGKSEIELQSMLKKIGADSLETLINETVPVGIRLNNPLNLPEAKSEVDFLTDFKALAQKNKIYKSFIGIGLQLNILDIPNTENNINANIDNSVTALFDKFKLKKPSNR